MAVAWATNARNGNNYEARKQIQTEYKQSEKIKPNFQPTEIAGSAQ